LLYEKFLERGKFVEFRQNLMFGQTIIDPNVEMGEGRGVGYIRYDINGGRPPEAERGELGSGAVVKKRDYGGLCCLKLALKVADGMLKCAPGFSASTPQ
jgi:hypothetical protein